MACTCKNEDGSLSSSCRGTCNQDKFVFNEVTLLRNQIAALSKQISELPNTLLKAKTDGFKEGYRQGYSDGKEDY